MKKVKIGAKPAVRPVPATADDWVKARGQTEATKRLTLDVPLSLHKRVKSQCALQELRMADVIREFLEQRFPS